MGQKPLVAIVGRPNVGKSTLFNRLSRQRAAIVSDVAGTTRDRVTTETIWADYPFILVDTGGLDLFPETDLWRQVKGQIETAISDADVLIMVVDAVDGVTAPDRDVADALRRVEKPLILAANKADNEEREARVQSEKLQGEEDQRKQLEFKARHQALLLTQEHDLASWQEDRLTQLFLEIETRNHEIGLDINLLTVDPAEFERRWAEFDEWADGRYQEILGPELFEQLFGED